MPVLPDDGSRIVSPGCEHAVLLGELDHLQRDAVLRRAARVLALELGVDADVGIRRQRVDADERRVADQPEDRSSIAHARRQPPATAGRIEITSPSATLVSSCSRYRMSSSFLYTFTNLWSPPSLVERLLGAGPGSGDQRLEHLAHRGALVRHGRRAVGVGAQQRGEQNGHGHGRHRTGQTASRPAGDGDVHLGDRAVADAVRPQRRLAVAQAHEHVEPRRVDRLTHVGWRRVRVGVGVRVPHADDLVAVCLGVAHRAQQVARLDGVRARRRVGVATRVHLRHIAGRVAVIAHGARQQSAGLVGEAVEAVRDDRAVLLGRESERGGARRRRGGRRSRVRQWLPPPGSRATRARP